MQNYSDHNKSKKRAFPFIKIGVMSFIWLIALIMTFVQNFVFYNQVISLLSFSSLHIYLFMATMFIFIFCVLNIFFSLLTWPYFGKVLIVVMLLLGAVIEYFMHAFKIVIDSDMIQNTFETNMQESVALISVKLVVFFILLGVIPAAIILSCRIQWRRYSYFKQVLYRVINIIISILVILVIAAFFYKDYASFFRNNKQVVKYIIPSNYISGTIKYFHLQYIDARPYVQIGLDAKQGDIIQSQKKKTLVIFVVGETARAENFGLGGYNRQTTPQLAQQPNVIYYPNTSSCGTSTAVSVPCMFSNMPRSSYDGVQADHQDNVLDMLSRAGINVLWRENDNGCKGVCNRVPSVEVTSWNLSDYCQDGACHDDILLKDLNKHIDSLKDNGVIILHQIGSHGPTYYRRYPDKFKKFTPVCNTNQIQDCSRDELVNTYDNTILYTDDVLNKTIELLKEHEKEFSTAMLYVSDHGESLGEKGMYLHGAPYMFAPSQQTHVPMLMWLSNDYVKGYHLDMNCLRKKTQDETSQDNIFHTLLGLFDIKTQEYQPSLDLLNQCRIP